MLLFSLFVACGDKNTEPAPPPVGWHAEEGWKGQCYFPPDFEQVQSTEGTSARRLARQEALEQMKSQWSGAREDGISFPPNYVEDVETTLLGRPDSIEAVAQKNLEHCKQVMGVGAAADAWKSWLGQLPEQLTAGECLNPLTATMFDYLDIGAGWQFSVNVCAGDAIRIEGTTQDKYRISEQGDWMTVEGLGESPADDAPCKLEGCAAGMLIGRFVSEDGAEELFPIGSETVYTPIAHGRVMVAINDATYYDNVYFQSGSITDHAGITISPAN
ncbi:MAG: hypothetical protein VX899_04000 [Myxococcota bacterium]|nr:hypothetical protein [Myxococcota bacterium]